MPADTLLQFEGLGAIDGQFNFAAGTLAFRQYRVADLKVRATLDHGALHVSRLACRAWGGTIEASGSADARGRRVAVKLAVNDVDVNALLETVVGKGLIEGTGRAVADVDSSGASVGALRKHLAGSVAVKVRSGAIKGIDLERTMRQVKLAVSRKQVPVIETGAKAKTHFEELTASARIAGGVAHSEDLDARTPLLRIGGAGRFDIGQGRIDYTARATVLASAAGQDGAELAALRGLTVPVVLSGPFDAIDWKIQWSDLAAAAVESRLKERIAKELGIEPVRAPPAVSGAASTPVRPEDKLLQQLKRLFK